MFEKQQDMTATLKKFRAVHALVDF